MLRRQGECACVGRRQHNHIECLRREILAVFVWFSWPELYEASGLGSIYISALIIVLHNHNVVIIIFALTNVCLLYTSPSPRDS